MSERDDEQFDLGIDDVTPETKAPAAEQQMVPLSQVQQMINDAIARFAGGVAADVEEEVKAGEPPPGCSGRKRTIIIEDVEGLPNFEVLGLNGHVIQVKRGEEVEIWEEYVEILRHAVSTFEPTLADVEKGNRITKNRNLIPWRLVS